MRKTKRGHVYLTHLDAGGSSRGIMEHLDCFTPGMLMLGADVLEKDLKRAHEKIPASSVVAGGKGGGLEASSAVAVAPPDTNAGELREFRSLAASLAETCYHM